MMFLPKRRRGITLTETLLAIAVGASLLIGAVVWYIQSQSQSKYETAQTQLQGLTANIRSYYDPIGSYTGLTNTVAIDAKLYPVNMLQGTVDTVNPRDPWGGDSYLSTTNGRTFTVTFAQVPSDACARMAQGNSGSLTALSIAGSTTGATIAAAATGTSLMSNGAMLTPDVIAKDCHTTDTGSGVTMSWTFN